MIISVIEITMIFFVFVIVDFNFTYLYYRVKYVGLNKLHNKIHVCFISYIILYVSFNLLYDGLVN